MRRAARAFSTPSWKACASSGSAFGGSSSVPSSISRGRKSAIRGLRVRGGLQARETELFALGVIGFGAGARQRAHAQDVALAFGHRDRAAGVEQVEAVRGLADLFVGGQRQAEFD